MVLSFGKEFLADRLNVMAQHLPGQTHCATADASAIVDLCSDSDFEDEPDLHVRAPVPSFLKLDLCEPEMDIRFGRLSENKLSRLTLQGVRPEHFDVYFQAFRTAKFNPENDEGAIWPDEENLVMSEVERTHAR